MAFWGDYHTHTIYSHGTSTIEENVIAAIKSGFKEIAITDHGFKHMTYNVRRLDWPHIQKDAERVRKKYPGINLYLGLETNFNSINGNIDIFPTDMKDLDIVNCGYHKFVKPDKLGDFFSFHLPNFILDTLRTSTKKRTRKNTDAYIKAIEKYDIDIITHINYGIKVDAVEVAKACVHYGTMVELNGKRINMTDAELEKMTEIGTVFIANSDAHNVQRVGDFSLCKATIDRIGIPLNQVANWEKIPLFRSQKSKRENVSIEKQRLLL